MSESKSRDVLIHLDGVSVRTNHGVSEAEREIGQRMVFDLSMTVPGCGATGTDRVEDTVDYGEVSGMLASMATERSRLTLECLVTEIAEAIVDRFPVSSVTVRATKPEPPVPQVMDGASVEVTVEAPGEDG
jgi:dihydroneopterin aldolase